MEWLTSNWHYILICIVVVLMAVEFIVIAIVWGAYRGAVKKRPFYDDAKDSGRKQ